MAHLIDKAALVAEIIHKIKVLEAFIKNFNGISDKVEKAKNKIEALNDELLFIESLEVKEVDLEKEIDRVWDNTSDNFLEDGWKEFEYIAKHFFELGIAVSNRDKI